MRGFFIDNAAFEKYHRRIGARRLYQILKKASDSTMFPEDPEKGDNLFKPKTEAEAEYWKLLREDIKLSAQKYLTTRNNGLKGGRPKKDLKSTDNNKESNNNADKIKTVCEGLAKKMTDRTNYKKVLITEDFNLAKLEGPIGEAFRMRYPPERTNILHRVSQWLRQPNRFLGEEVDSNWLNRQVQRFANEI